MILLDALLSVLKDHRIPGWLVGGTVRDRQLGRSSPDVDVVVDGDPLRVARALADRTGLPWFALSREWGAYRVVGTDGHLDVAAVRGGSLVSDLALRDFTVNAMALPVEGGPVVDPYGGRRHLGEGRLVAVGPTIFADDPLRLMRAVRLGHTLGLAVDDDLRRLARQDAWRLAEAAAERVLAEVVSTLRVGRSAAAVMAWDDLGLLPVFLPEVAALKGVTQSAFHHRDVFGHTVEAVERLDELVADPGRWFGRSWELLRARLSTPVDGAMPRPVAVRIAVLMHDVGKPATRTVDPTGRVIFWGHTELGGEMAAGVCARLRCSEATTALVRRVAERHLALGFLQDDESLTARAEVRYLWDASPWEPEVILASVADRRATLGRLTDTRAVESHLSLARRLMDRWRGRVEAGVPRPPVDGHDLMEALGLGPGPLLGRVMREVALAWEAGEVVGAAETLDHAREVLARITTTPAD